MKTLAFALCFLAFTSAFGCDSCSKKKDDVAVEPAKKVDPHGPPQMPPAGTDADVKRIAALALADKINGSLATFKHDMKPYNGGTAEVWWIEAAPEQPKKLIVTDASGGKTEIYFDDKAMMQYAVAPDGHFIFALESLALWLDPQQRLKRGIKPQDAGVRANALKSNMADALTVFRLR